MQYLNIITLTKAELKRYVAELEAELAKHEWVSVEDRLPEDQQEEVLWYKAGFPVRWEDSEVFFESSLEYTHWKPITLPRNDSMSTVKPATFLPDCKYQRHTCNVTFCADIENARFDKPCSKRCETPTIE